MSIHTPIYLGKAQSDLDMAGFNLLNWTDPGGGGGGSGLDANTVTAASIGMVGDGVTDNTTALQAWLTSVETAKVNSTLLVPDGVYIFSGPLQDGSRRNAQILLPTASHTDPAYSVTIKGYHPINFAYWPDDGSHFPLPAGPVFKTTLATGGGTRPAFIGGRGPIGGIGPEDNYLVLRLENMIFQTVTNPLISCLNFDHISYTELMGDILIIAGSHTSEADVVQPTHTDSYGLIYPGSSYSILHSCDNINVMGFYTGILLGENCILSAPGVWNCVCGFEAGFAYGILMVRFMSIGHCTYGLNISGAANIKIDMFNTEHGPAGHWYTLVYDILDPSNQAIGEVTWWQNTAFVGPGTDFRINGGSGIQARRLGSTIGSDLRLAQLTGGGKLQARNTGTNTWADVDQWTNP